MKIHTIITYSFSELSEDAKQEAIKSYHYIDAGYHWYDEWINSLKKFCDVTGINLINYNFQRGGITYNYYLNNIDLTDLKGLRLRAWLINNWLPKFEKGKFIIKFIGANLKSYHSKCQTEISCPLTGYCGDMSLIEPILEFINKPNDSNLEDVINECMSRFQKEFCADMEYQDSDKYVSEHIEANEYEFLESGKIYR